MYLTPFLYQLATCGMSKLAEKMAAQWWHHRKFSHLLTNPIQEKLLDNKSLSILSESYHKSLPSFPGFVILFGCAPVYIPEKKGGYNAFVRPLFFVANSGESR